MHPAVKAHIDGNLSIIRSCLGQIEAAMSANELGHPNVMQAATSRAEKEQSGVETPYLDDDHEALLKDGFGQLWSQAQNDENAQVTNEKIAGPTE